MAANNEVKCAVTPCPNMARAGKRTCSPGCAQLWREVYRYQVDRERTNQNQARTILKHPEKYKKSRRDWAERVLGVEVPSP